MRKPSTSLLIKLCYTFTIFIFICSLKGTAQNGEQHSQTSSVLWYNTPGKKWDEALPVGNGRLGAMVYGKKFEEQIQFNEDTYWTGGPYSTVVKGGYKVLPQIQKLVFEQKFLEAHNLFGRYLMGYPVEQQKYQSMGNLHLFFESQDSVTEFKRSLDLETGVASIDYRVNEVKFHREIFASAPDQVIVIRLTADKPGSISFTANLRGVRNQAFSNYATDYFRMDPYGKDGMKLTGKSADYLGIKGQLKYEARIKVVPEGGKMEINGVDLKVVNANTVTIYLVAATNFVNYKNVGADCHARVEEYLKKLSAKNYEQIRESAINDFQNLFSRVYINLPDGVNSFLPTNERLRKISESPDPSLAALCYNFGRYILISSSRKGTQPANLQGIWNNDMNPAWDSKYTTNINTEMNYWAAESGNLSDCAEPLFKMIKELTDQGSQVAREHYGARGWVFHQNTDLWRVAAPMDGPTWGTFTVGGAWLCTHLWEHYAYTMDKKFLEEYFPIMQGSVLFFMDFLVKHPNGKWLVTNPSTSPENFPDGGGNKPYYDEVTGSILKGTTICAGSAIDMEILYDLFGYYLKACKVLGRQSSFIDSVSTARSKLVPPQIGSDGSLQEWSDDWHSIEEHHRHFSHLYGLYPGLELWEKRTPELIEAYKKVLENRGDGSTGWSRAWKMCLWARLGDGNRANNIWKGYLQNQCLPQLFAQCGPPMQVDGTFGVTAAITEMLMQSQDGYIRLLPAIPDEWKEGIISGLCARGGFVLNFKWKDGKLTDLKIKSKAGGICRIKVDTKVFKSMQEIQTQKSADGIMSFATEKGSEYSFEMGN
ncbi:MAG: alpha-L-fucosidase [Bacteroidetes bacterium]|nr:MAG: alpha-L-fucosidase [Bacteroidota bacterium]